MYAQICVANPHVYTFPHGGPACTSGVTQWVLSNVCDVGPGPLVRLAMFPSSTSEVCRKWQKERRRRRRREKEVGRLTCALLYRQHVARPCMVNLANMLQGDHACMLAYIHACSMWEALVNENRTVSSWSVVHRQKQAKAG
jgi:hypothetical protein